VTARQHSNTHKNKTKNENMKLHKMLIQAVAAVVNSFRGLALAGNTYDAAVSTHESAITRTNDAAVTARHLLWATGAAPGGVKVNTAATIPMGTVDNTETATGVRQAVLLLGKGSTKKMVASEAITEGEQVYGDAAGKVSDLPAGAGTYYCVGTAVTGAGQDDDILEVADCVPFAVVVA
jgi:hypothetical protein